VTLRSVRAALVALALGLCAACAGGRPASPPPAALTRVVLDEARTAVGCVAEAKGNPAKLAACEAGDAAARVVNAVDLAAKLAEADSGP
jgi:hypothetical protein